ncbi:DUF434 domain-containing protein [Leptobacterium flavescens]|uniref:DUF434 domain-containing protein n=1 Tax=Leptobacterium flavescens TaxID=472055 RepID=A0A6P0UTU8_9FLAO|nr:DUF434 domain-containing protein [Leptobacterium flavescens]NER14263.1 DUF434 domain-containing protein [Leptobacterium flavescens]
MSSSTRKRGKEGSDDRLFGTPAMQKKLKEAAGDMCYLLSRGYGERSSLQLVGNRYKLNVRQQKALLGMSAGSQQITSRRARLVSADALKDQSLSIDGFNLLIILESALSGAYVFKGLDDCYRDISGVHGTYKRIQKTEEALLLIGNNLNSLGVKQVHWILDKPVSNSGRLKSMMNELAEEYAFPWEISLENNPDTYLAESASVVVSSDAWILDRATRWFNLGAYLIEDCIEDANVIFSK